MSMAVLELRTEWFGFQLKLSRSKKTVFPYFKCGAFIETKVCTLSSDAALKKMSNTNTVFRRVETELGTIIQLKKFWQKRTQRMYERQYLSRQRIKIYSFVVIFYGNCKDKYCLCTYFLFFF